MAESNDLRFKHLRGTSIPNPADVPADAERQLIDLEPLAPEKGRWITALASKIDMVQPPSASLCRGCNGTGSGPRTCPATFWRNVQMPSYVSGCKGPQAVTSSANS